MMHKVQRSGDSWWLNTLIKHFMLFFPSGRYILSIISQIMLSSHSQIETNIGRNCLFTDWSVVTYRRCWRLFKNYLITCLPHGTSAVHSTIMRWTNRDPNCTLSHSSPHTPQLPSVKQNLFPRIQPCPTMASFLASMNNSSVHSLRAIKPWGTMSGSSPSNLTASSPNWSKHPLTPSQVSLPPLPVRYCVTLELWKVFNHAVQGKVAAKHLLSLHQGPCNVAECLLDFRILAAESGWNEEALQGVFLNGFSELVKGKLAVKDESVSLDMLISLTIWLGNRMREQHRERTSQSQASQADRPSPRLLANLTPELQSSPWVPA